MDVRRYHLKEENKYERENIKEFLEKVAEEVVNADAVTKVTGIASSVAAL